MGKTPQPQLPIILFSDGAEFEVIRSTPNMKDGIPSVTLHLSPFPETMELYDITSDDLVWDIYEFGIIERTFPESRIWKLRDNPVKPVWVGFCTFDGTKRRVNSEEFRKIQEFIDAIERLQKELAVKNKYIAKLESDNQMLATRSREFSETYGRFMKGGREIVTLPGEGETEVEVKRKQIV